MQPTGSTEDFPFAPYHKRYYSKFAIPDVKRVPGNALTLMFHSNGIAVLTLAKNHIARALIHDPPRLSVFSEEIERHISVHRRVELGDQPLPEVSPFGYSLEWVWKRTEATNASKTLRAFFLYSSDRNTSTHAPKLQHLISVNETAQNSTNYENPKKKQKKSTIQAETGMGSCVLTFYYGNHDEDAVYEAHTDVQYTFPLTPCIPCEILEHNDLVLPETPPSAMGDERARLPLECPCDLGFLAVLNPSWKFRDEVLPKLLAVANSTENSVGKPVGENTDLSKAYSTWVVVEGKSESDFEASNDLKVE